MAVPIERSFLHPLNRIPRFIQNPPFGLAFAFLLFLWGGRLRKILLFLRLLTGLIGIVLFLFNYIALFGWESIFLTAECAGLEQAVSFQAEGNVGIEAGEQGAPRGSVDQDSIWDEVARREREDERRLMGSREYRAAERNFNLFYGKRDLLTEKARELVVKREIPVQDPEDVRRAINILSEEALHQENRLRRIRRAINSIENPNSALWKDFLKALSYLEGR